MTDRPTTPYPPRYYIEQVKFSFVLYDRNDQLFRLASPDVSLLEKVSAFLESAHRQELAARALQEHIDARKATLQVPTTTIPTEEPQK